MTPSQHPDSSAATILAALVILAVIAKLVFKELFHDIIYLYCWIRNVFTEVKLEQDLTTKATLDYLRSSFSNPENLIKGMAKNNFILSGSRALDLFVPGSASRDSDWDFYIPNNQACIAGALHTLSECGVVWDDFLTPYRRLLQCENEETMHMTEKSANVFVAAWDRYEETKDSSKCDSDLLGLIGDIEAAVVDFLRDSNLMERTIKFKKATIHIHATNYHKESYNSSFSHSVNMRETSSYGPSMNIVRGTTTFNGTSQTVQLISSPGKSPVDLILAFYASHVQCFVSAFGAAHLYYDSSKQAFTWPLNTQHRPSADAALEKYKQRGFVFSTKGKKHGHRQLRQLSDRLGQGKLVEFTFDFKFADVPDAVQALRRQALKRLMWIETAERTWRVADAEVEEGMRAWAKVRSRRVLRGEEVEDGVGEEAMGCLDDYVLFEADMRQKRDTILLF